VLLDEWSGEGLRQAVGDGRQMIRSPSIDSSLWSIPKSVNQKLQEIGFRRQGYPTYQRFMRDQEQNQMKLQDPYATLIGNQPRRKIIFYGANCFCEAKSIVTVSNS
jgi:hypothetical protein